MAVDFMGRYHETKLVVSYTYVVIWDDWTCDSTMQERLVTGTVFVHETCGSYKSVEELWDGETSDADFPMTGSWSSISRQVCLLDDK